MQSSPTDHNRLTTVNCQLSPHAYHQHPHPPHPQGQRGQDSLVAAAVGSLTSLVDPVGNQTAWAYYNLNRLTSETNELNDTRTWA